MYSWNVLCLTDSSTDWDVPVDLFGEDTGFMGVEVTVHIKSDVPEAIISDKIWIQVQVSLYVLLH